MTNLKCLSFCLLLSLLNGCATFGYASTADYVESVFKRQNAISTLIMMLSDSDLSAKDYDSLLQTEAKMQQACRLLNSYAIKEMSHESTSLLFKKQVKDSAENCEASTDDVESLLDDLDIEFDE